MLGVKGMFVFKALNGLVAKVSYWSGQVTPYFCALQAKESTWIKHRAWEIDGTSLSLFIFIFI